METVMKILILCISFFMFLLSGSAIADESINCRGKIIDRGMTMEEVRKHCGKPDYSSVDDQAVHQGNKIRGTTPVTTWHYKQPGGMLIAVLVFDVDKLQSIKLVDKYEEEF